MEKANKLSDFMRNRRPELFSDSNDEEDFKIRKEELELFLNTITARNETNKFETFCRKLCQRVICPNLLPPTGPEGGGDSKADTETYAVSEEISGSYFIGQANAGKEKWAFTISAKEKWKDKIKSDVRGLIETGRKFDKIYCLSSRYIKSKEIAHLKAELLSQYSVPIEIFDRTWIVEKVLNDGCGDVAHFYLGVGEKNNKRVVGPNDYRREQQLEKIESEITDSLNNELSRIQLVEDSIVAVKLSRELDRPRFETEGRLERAIRYAEKYGTFKQKLDANFEKLRTYCWWFDDIETLNDLFDEYAELAYSSGLAIDIQNVGAFLNVISVAAGLNRLKESAANIDIRVNKYRNILNFYASENTIRPNNAIEAKLQLCKLDMSPAINKQRPINLKSIWDRMRQILDESNGLGEFDPNVIADYLETIGQIQSYDEKFDDLVEHCATVLGEREGEVSEGIRLLKRAEQLSLDSPCELIRIAGKAASKLAKAETNSELIRALYILGAAYRSIGLLWAARASFQYASSLCYIDAIEKNRSRIESIPVAKAWVWACLELRKIPEFVEAYESFAMTSAMIDLDDSSFERVKNDLVELDCAFASQIFHIGKRGIFELLKRTEVLEVAGLQMARMSLLYRTGHESQLRVEGWIPNDETIEDTNAFFSKVANQPINEEFLSNEIFYFAQETHCITTTIFGLKIEICFPNVQWAINLAEILSASLEAFFATTHERRLIPHSESITLHIRAGNSDYGLFEANALEMTATINWDLKNDFSKQAASSIAVNCLREVIYGVAAFAFVGDLQQALDKFHFKDYFHYRLALIISSINSYNRVFSKFCSRIDDFPIDRQNNFEFLDSNPEIKIVPCIQSSEAKNFTLTSDDQAMSASAKNIKFSHRKSAVLSLINIHAWDIAKWCGTAFIVMPTTRNPPILILLFKEAVAAESIFRFWRKKFGSIDSNEELKISIVRQVDKINPAHYKVVISTNLESDKNKEKNINIIMGVKSNLMEPKSAENLDVFLAHFRKVGSYLLVPGLMGENGSFKLRKDLGILKECLKVMPLKDLRKNDVEAMAFPEKFRK